MPQNVEYISDAKFVRIVERDDCVQVELASGTKMQFDVLIGADGYKSTTRKALFPAARPESAGYVAWRGNYLESRLKGDARRAIDFLDTFEAGGWATPVFDGGHGIIYKIPDPFGDGERVNWVIYTLPPPGSDDFSEARSVPEGSVTEAQHAHLKKYAEKFPVAYRAIIAASTRKEVSIQPIYDLVVPSYAKGSVALLGDAGSIVRPHTASGSSKAMMDALALREAATSHKLWRDALDAYSASRTEVGAKLVELGKSIGNFQVINSAGWGRFDEAALRRRVKMSMGGQKLFLRQASSSTTTSK